MAFSNEKVLLFLAANADRNDKLFIDYEEIIHPTNTDVALLHVAMNMLLAQLADLYLDPDENPSPQFYRDRITYIWNDNKKLFPNVQSVKELTDADIDKIFSKIAVLFG